LKTGLDENSIAPSRGDFPHTPDSRIAKLIDDRARQYLSAREASAVLPGTSAPLNTPLGPGESHFTTFLFDVPADARNPRLLISDVDPVSASSGPSRKQPAARGNLSGLNPSAAATASDLQ
jgi:hypothetical protein